MTRPDQQSDEQLRIIETAPTPDFEAGEGEQASDESDFADTSLEEDLPQPYRDRWTFIAAIGCSLVAVAWTALFLWANAQIFGGTDFVATLSSLIAQWSMPMALIAALYWMVSRRRSAQLSYFRDEALLVDRASRQLEERLQYVNGELAIASEFISNQSTQLDSVGRRAISDITHHAERIAQLVGNSRENMEAVANVSATAETNMTKLREQMPVVISTSKNLVNQIAAVGMTGQKQIKAMIDGFRKINEFGKASDQQVIDLDARIDRALTALQSKLEQIDAMSTTSGNTLINNANIAAQTLDDSQNKAASGLVAFVDKLENSLDTTGQKFAEQIEHYTALTQQINEEQKARADQVDSIFSAFEERINTIETVLEEQDNIAVDKAAKMSFALSALRSELEHITGSLRSSDAMASQLQLQGENLRDGFAKLAAEIENNITVKMDGVAQAFDENGAKTQAAADHIAHITSAMHSIDQMTNSNIMALSEQEDHIAAYTKNFDAFSTRQNAQCAQALETIGELQNSIAELEAASDSKILAKFAEIGDSSEALLTKVESDLGGVISQLTSNMAERSGAALETAVREKSDEIIGKLQLAVNHALGATHQASASLTAQLNTIDRLATNLEERVASLQETSQSTVEQELSHNVALLTESLNSTSIDVAKVLSNDVTDTAWAAYMKGDRGIFTRRAVRLLSNSEVREVIEQYESDPEFHETVNRYIHDFEAILRDLLSMRNGEAISVTLLSSDMGKLYVALAQAIERFR